LADWLYEQGIGENRAALVEDRRILEAAIELPGSLRTGAIVEGRLTNILVPARRGIVAVSGEEALIEPLPPRLTEGQAVRVEIVREAIPEKGRPKLARCRFTDDPPRPGATLAQRIGAFTDIGPAGLDRLEEAGWSELIEEALTGEIAFAGGGLRMSLTPAMTLFDVDGALPPEELALAGARAAAETVRRFGIGGSIGLDLPTLPSRAVRQAAAAIVDDILPQPFERTAVNGFGFLQIVRRRERASIPEIVRNDPAGAAARALLKRAERSVGAGERTLTASPAVLSAIEANPQWIETLAGRIGASVVLRAEPGLPIWAGHVHARFA
jgi:hypothetical protein